MGKAVRELGSTQKQVLQSLRDHGSWSRGCGWIWDNNSVTERVLDSLMARGLVHRTASQDDDGYIRVTYRPVEKEE
jgi:hypothetical protein